MDAEKITVADAIEHFKGEVYSARVWLEQHGRGAKPQHRRPEHNIEEFERKLRFRMWVVEQLEKSQRGKG